MAATKRCVACRSWLATLGLITCLSAEDQSYANRNIYKARFFLTFSGCGGMWRAASEIFEIGDLHYCPAGVD